MLYSVKKTALQTKPNFKVRNFKVANVKRLKATYDVVGFGDSMNALLRDAQMHLFCLKSNELTNRLKI